MIDANPKPMSCQRHLSIYSTIAYAQTHHRDSSFVYTTHNPPQLLYFKFLVVMLVILFSHSLYIVGLGNLPVKRAKDAMCFLQWCGLRLLSVVSSAIIYNIVFEKVTRWPIDLLTRWPFRKRTPQEQFQGPPTYTHHPSRCSAAKGAFCSNQTLRCSSSKAKGALCSCVAWSWRICNKLKWPVDPSTRWPFRKRSPQGQFRGPPTYTHQVWRSSVKGPRRSRGTNRQTNRQTNAAWIIVWCFCSAVI